MLKTVPCDNISSSKHWKVSRTPSCSLGFENVYKNSVQLGQYLVEIVMEWCKNCVNKSTVWLFSTSKSTEGFLFS